VGGDPAVPGRAQVQPVGRPARRLVQALVVPVVHERDARVVDRPVAHRAGQRLGPAVDHPAQRQPAGRVGAGDHQHLDAVVDGPSGGLPGQLAEPAGVEAQAQRVVAAAVEGQQVRAQRAGRGQLLGDDRLEQQPAHGQVRVADRLVGGVLQPAGDQVGPAAHGPVGHLVPDALGEAVPDRDEAAVRLHVEDPPGRSGRSPANDTTTRQAAFCPASRSAAT
jgi:hypothetical protein